MLDSDIAALESKMVAVAEGFAALKKQNEDIQNSVDALKKQSDDITYAFAGSPLTRTACQVPSSSTKASAMLQSQAIKDLSELAGMPVKEFAANVDAMFSRRDNLLRSDLDAVVELRQAPR